MRKSLFCLMVLMSTAAFAKDEGIMSLKVIETTGRNYPNEGWSCGRSWENSHIEKLVDHTGKVKTFERTGDNSVHMDLGASSPVKVNILEKCEYTTFNTTYSTTCDEKNNCTTTSNTTSDTEYVKVEWSCNISKLPMHVGQKVIVDCPQGDSSGEYNNSSLYSNMKKLVFKAELTLNKRYESFAVDLCKGRDLKKRKIIKLTQGLDGLPAERDFVVTIEIPGLTSPIKLKNEKGIFNDEIAICRDGDIPLSVKAVEEDPIWDDIYSCDAHANEIVLSTKKWGSDVATIDFIRDNTWDKIFLDKKQQLRFEIREAPIK